jgi:proline dehydrogenase
MLARSLIIKTSSLAPIERIVRRSRLVRPLVNRFIAGDTLEEALAASQDLLRKGLQVSLDILGENTNSEAEALSAKATYIRMLDAIASVPEAANKSEGIERLNISIKLTQCGLDMGEAFAENNLREVLDCAKSHDNFVRIDMESSEYTERTMNLMSRVIPDYENTGTVLQSYLKRTPDDLERLIALNSRVRLVKGAYLEPASVAFPDKSKVDEMYVQQAKRMLDAARYPALATHDESIIKTLKAYAQEKGIRKEGFEFQMLYGIRRDLQESLVREGYRVRVYVPFGDAWYPYFTRRLAERPANVGFIVRSLFKG